VSGAPRRGKQGYTILLTTPSFLFSFFTPYLLNAPYADLKSKVGLIYGSIAVLSFFFAFFCVPETKGRSLEDINLMFEKGLSVNEFRTYAIEQPETKIATDHYQKAVEAANPASPGTCEEEIENKAVEVVEG
jgi:hypothetical protein